MDIGVDQPGQFKFREFPLVQLVVSLVSHVSLLRWVDAADLFQATEKFSVFIIFKNCR